MSKFTEIYNYVWPLKVWFCIQTILGDAHHHPGRGQKNNYFENKTETTNPGRAHETTNH